MKKYVFNLNHHLLFICVCGIVFSFSILAVPFCSSFKADKHVANATENTKIEYAKIKEGCYLFKDSSMSQDIQNIYFCLPESYFVAILNSVSDNVVKVQYSCYIGFCFLDTIDKVSFIPQTPYLENITFDIHTNVGTQVWSLPSDTKSTKYTTIPAGTTNIKYISFATGDIPTGGNVNIWYYAQYTPASNSTSVYEGYIYSEATLNLSNIAKNLEVENIVDQPSTSNTIKISQTLKVVLIVLICLPFVILFLVSLVKGVRQLKTKTKPTTPSQPETSTAIHNTSYIKKQKLKRPIFANNNSDDVETIEVAFPQYDYIDDDDLL